MDYKLHLYLIIVNLLAVTAVAQNSQVSFSRLTIDDGLSQSHVQCIIQDSKGFMWFATRDGLNKWDGYKFTIYRNDENDTNSISGNRIESILEDRDGTIWIATFFNGLCSYDPTTDRFTQYKRLKAFEGNRLILATRDLTIDDNGNVWAFFQEGIGYIQRGSTQLKFTHNFDFFGQEFADFFIQNIRNTAHDSLFNDDVVKYYLKLCADSSIKSMKLSHLDVYSGNGEFKNIIIDTNDNVWLGAKGKGLYRLNDSFELIQYYGNYVANRQSMSKEIRDMIQTHSGEFWIGTDGDGVNVFNSQTGEVTAYLNNHYDNHSIAGDAIYSVYEDNTGIIWLGHFNDGISYYDKNAVKFIPYVHDPEDTQSISDKPVLSVYEDSKSRIWVGTDGGGLNLFNKEDGTFRHFTKENTNLSSNVITAIHEDSKGNILLGTWNGGLMVFNPETLHVKNYHTQSSGKTKISSNHVWAIEEDKNGLIWLGLLGSRYANYFDPATEEFHDYTTFTKTGNIMRSQIMTIMEDRHGDLWFGTEGGGVFKYLVDEKKMMPFQHKESTSNSPVSNVVLTLFEDSEGNIWMGSQDKGVSVYNPKTDTYTLLDETWGLPSNVIQGVVEDENNTFWISTTNGICHYNRAANSFVNYDVTDGLQGNEFKYNASIIDSEGHIYMGGMNGMNVFHADEIGKSKYMPPVYFTELKLFNQPVTIGATGSPLTQHISETERIVLNHKQNVFTLSFVALNYTSTEKTEYRYKMIGFDEEYINSEHTRSVTYMNLSPGEYVFHVQASNNDGVWNNEGAKLIIVVTPPWWKTIWFRVTSTLMVIVLFIAFYTYRLNAVKRYNTRLEKKVKQRTQQLTTKNKEISKANELLEERQSRIMEQSEEIKTQRDGLAAANEVKDKLFSVIAHDVKNPFSALLGLTELLKERYSGYTDEKRLKFIGSIHEASSRVYELITSLLYWSRTQQGDIIPQIEPYNIVAILNKNIDLATLQAQKKEISINKMFSLASLECQIDKDLVDVVVRNLLSNAVKFTHHSGKVEVGCRKTGDHAVVSVKDNGVGMDDATLKRLLNAQIQVSTYGTDDERGTGLGLVLCREFVELQGGELKIESKKGEGSEFSFRLPLQ